MSTSFIAKSIEKQQEALTKLMEFPLLEDLVHRIAEAESEGDPDEECGVRQEDRRGAPDWKDTRHGGGRREDRRDAPDWRAAGHKGGRSLTDYFPDSDEFNMIPSDQPAPCRWNLVTICYGKDSFENRIIESLDHASLHCKGTCKKIFFLSTRWNSQTIDKLRGYIEAVRASGVEINFYYITAKGIVWMPV